ncbi:hypothetical protein [Luteimonas vadosa]|uniref:Uncharacterized protein n=1 Tax=Luteimonas vadosa TaxID=1165507 RepID=A0ABP9DU80_9GAMM
MSIYSDLLFLGGHVGDIDLAHSLETAAPAPRKAQAASSKASGDRAVEGVPLAATETETAPSYRPRSWRYPMRLFDALMPLDHAPAATPGLGVGDRPFEPTYGNERAWRRRFPAYGSTRPKTAPASCRTCLA